MKYFKIVLRVLPLLSLLFVFGYGAAFACQDDSGLACNYDGDDSTMCDYQCGNVTCPDGSTAASESECPSDFTVCPDGSVLEGAGHESECPTEPDYTTCPDGSVIEGAGHEDECPPNDFAYCIYTDPSGSECQAAHPNGNCYPDNEGSSCSEGDFPYCVYTDPSGADCQAAHPHGNCYPDNDSATCNPDKVYYCSNLAATNGMTGTDCQGANPGKTCEVDDDTCDFPAYGCIDPSACNYDPYAYTDDGSCEYDTCTGCMDDTATNYDPEAKFADDSCEYQAFCGYDVVGQYTFRGVTYKVEVIAAYFYDPQVESCEPPNLNNVIPPVLDPLPYPPPSATTADGIPIVPLTDQCENIDGDQSYDTFVNGGYERLANGDCHICIDENENGICDDEEVHPEPAECNPDLTILTPDEVTVGQPLAGDVGCSEGVGGAVSTSNDPQGDPLYVWTCFAEDGNASCSASVGQCPEETPNYCYGECTADPTCEEPPVPPPNPNIGGRGGKVRLNPRLKVTPIIDQGETCTVNWGKNAFGTNQGVFIESTTTTRCTLSDQSRTLLTFDVSNQNAPMATSVQNVLKDENFTLRCYETNDALWPAATSTGSCRLNIRPEEYN